MARRTLSDPQVQEFASISISEPKVPKEDRLFAIDPRYELTSSKGNSVLAEAAEQPRQSS